MAAERILIGADNELVAMSLQGQLAALNYNVVDIARSADNIVQLGLRYQPDLLILDIQMPDLTRSLIAGQLSPSLHLPVIVLTDFADSESVRKAEVSGVLGYLVKPVNSEELPPAIDIALARFHELRRLREHAEELHATIEARKLIERATGVLMKRLNINHEEAEERLYKRSKDQKTSIRDVAQAIIESDALLS